MEEPGFSFQFTLTPAEAGGALRRVRYFRLGHATGIIAHALLIPSLLIYAVVGIFVAVSRENEPFSLIAAAVAFFLLLLLVLNALRGITTHAHAEPRGVQNVQLFIADAGIRINHPQGERLHPWTEFTALIWTADTFIIMTTRVYVPIPRRVIPPELLRGFEIYVRGKCIKQGISHDFPVLVDSPTCSADTLRADTPQSGTRATDSPPA